MIQLSFSCPLKQPINYGFNDNTFNHLISSEKKKRERTERKWDQFQTSNLPGGDFVHNYFLSFNQMCNSYTFLKLMHMYFMWISFTRTGLNLVRFDRRGLYFKMTNNYRPEYANYERFKAISTKQLGFFYGHNNNH